MTDELRAPALRAKLIKLEKDLDDLVEMFGLTSKQEKRLRQVLAEMAETQSQLAERSVGGLHKLISPRPQE